MIFWLVSALVLSVATANLSDNLKQFQDGNLQFSIDMFKEVVKADSQNTMLCPLSADIALAMALIGARGETQRQLAAGTHLAPNPEKLKATFAELLPQLQSSDKYAFELANKVYIQKGFLVQENYHKSIVEDFKSEVENIEFKEKDVAVSKVNKWVSEKTHDKIKGIIEPQHINNDTRAILLNAMYFKGQWVKGFKTVDTKKHAFYVDKSHFINTDMMTTKGDFRYYEDLDYKVRLLEMPYKGDDVTMTIVLPDNPEGLPEVVKNLEKIIVSPNYFFSRTVNLAVPKFKIESSIKLKTVLESLGVDLPFKDGANFNGITKNPSEPLKIADVLQKGTIEVDEHGTIGTASTAVIMQTWRSAKVFQDVYFHANHPFVFYIKHKTAGIIFLGQYVKPQGTVQAGNYPEPRSHTYNKVMLS